MRSDSGEVETEVCDDAYYRPLSGAPEALGTHPRRPPESDAPSRQRGHSFKARADAGDDNDADERQAVEMIDEWRTGPEAELTTLWIGAAWCTKAEDDEPKDNRSREVLGQQLE